MADARRSPMPEQGAGFPMTGPGSEPRHKWLLLATVSVGSLLVSLDASILVVCLPRLAVLFGTDASVIAWVNLAYLIVSQSLMLTLAKIGDLRGRKVVYVVGLAFYTAGLAICALSQSVTQLILGRAIQGVGGATTLSLSMAITLAAFPSHERGKALGVLTSVGSLGLVAGPVLGGLILDGLGWRGIFFVRIPVAVAGLLLAWVLVEEQQPEGVTLPLDTAGALSLFGCLSTFLLYLNQGGRLGFCHLYVPALGAASLVFLFLFLYAERRAAEPLIDLRLFARRSFSLALISASLQPGCTGLAIFLLPFYMTGGLGYSDAGVGVFMSALAIPHLFLSPASGKLSDRVGSRILATCGMIIAFGALFFLRSLGYHPTTVSVGVGVGLLGAALGVFLPPNNSCVMGSVPRDMLGAAAAVLTTARQIGSSSGVAVASALFAARQAQHLGSFLERGLGAAAARRTATVLSFQDALAVGLVVGGVGILTSMSGGMKKGVS